MTNEVARWNCESYCRCGSRQGHFERQDDGVWVKYDDIKNLLQVEPGVPQWLEDARVAWNANCRCACSACAAFDTKLIKARSALNRGAPHE